MTIELGKRLASLRKEKGYSQEDLAAKLGVSRQAVSKWENGEASPDTDNLIALADIYGISLDELVGKKEREEVYEGEVVDGGVSNVRDDLDEDDDDDDDDDEIGGSIRKAGRGATAKAIISSVGFLVALIAYLIVGFTWKGPTGGLGWAVGWILLLLPVIIGGTVFAIASRRFTRFPIAILVVAVYLGMGIIGNAYGLNLWHPYWVLFLLIPLYHAVVAPIDVAIRAKGRK